VVRIACLPLPAPGSAGARVVPAVPLVRVVRPVRVRPGGGERPGCRGFFRCGRPCVRWCGRREGVRERYAVRCGRSRTPSFSYASFSYAVPAVRGLCRTWSRGASRGWSTNGGGPARPGGARPRSAGDPDVITPGPEPYRPVVLSFRTLARVTGFRPSPHWAEALSRKYPERLRRRSPRAVRHPASPGGELPQSTAAPRPHLLFRPTSLFVAARARRVRPVGTAPDTGKQPRTMLDMS
jgi:hypothetical protein